MTIECMGEVRGTTIELGVCHASPGVSSGSQGELGREKGGEGGRDAGGEILTSSPRRHATSGTWGRQFPQFLVKFWESKVDPLPGLVPPTTQPPELPPEMATQQGDTAKERQCQAYA